jgi:hypothetical protein
MRGGAIPLIAWGTLLILLLALNWIWTGDAIQVGSFGFAVLVVYGVAVVLWLLSREALRRGPPEARRRPETLPEASASSIGIGLSISSILFGLVWAKFLVYFGAGLLLLSLGRLVLELRAEKDSRIRAERGSGR